MELRSPDRNLFLGYVFGEGTRAESMLVPRVEVFDTPLDTPLEVGRVKDVLILLPLPLVLSIGLAIPFSSNGGCKGQIKYFNTLFC